MVGTPAASAVYDFENILPQLDFLPIAARRALDHAGLRLSLEAWRSLGLDDRCQLVAAGGNDVVDSSAVAAVVRRAAPQAQRIEVVGDPDPLAPPDGLTRLLEPVPLDARQWARLRALDRYALAHVHRRSIARNDPTLIQAAYEDIVTGHLRSLRPPPADTSDRDFTSTVPPPPPLPGGRAMRVRELTPISYDPPSRTPAYEPPAAAAYEAPSRGRAYETPAAAAYEAPARGRAYEPPSPATYDTPTRVRAYETPPPAAPVYESPPPPSGGPLSLPDLAPLDRDHRSSALSSHLSEAGEARMVDVGAKPATERRAVASALVRMRRDTFQRLVQRDTPKGDVLAAARIAGIQAAKRTSELIPLCHAIALTRVEVHIELDSASSTAQVIATAEACDRTGVEMEALVAASIASLTIYDMLKGIDRDMSIDDLKLLEKRGGRTGAYRRRDT